MRLRGGHRPIVLVLGLSAMLCLGTTACVPRDVVQPVSLEMPSSAGGSPTKPQASASTNPSPASGATQVPSPADDVMKPLYAQKPQWSDCVPDDGSLMSKAGLAGFQCATLRLPVDYAHPGGGDLDLAVVRKPAVDTAHRIGALVVDPGGPGGSGVDFVEGSGKTDFKALNQRYDIVGFDPRGVGRTDPVRCLNVGPGDPLIVHGLPADAAVRQEKQVAAFKKYADDCEAGAGGIIAYVGTRSTVRDMDVLRQVLGDQKLNYMGFSYGTYLGTVYAETYPQNVGRMILDGAVDPAMDPFTARILQQVAFEKAFERFAADCVTNHRSSCPLGSDPAAAAAKAGKALDALPSSSPGGITSSEAWGVVIDALYDAARWADLRALLAGVMSGSLPSLAPGAGITPRTPTTGASTSALPMTTPPDVLSGLPMNGRESDAFHAIQCADFADPAPTPDRVQQAFQQLKRDAPVLSTQLQPSDLASTICQYWRFQTPEKPHVMHAQGAAPILVVGTTGDPATPYAQSVTLAKDFAHATLLTRVGEGHTAFGSGNACVDKAEQAFLFDGTMPASGTRCTA